MTSEARFAQQVIKLGARCELVPDEEAARKSLHAIVAEHDARSFAVSNAPLARRVVVGLETEPEIVEDLSDREALLRADVGVTSVQWAIAETGSLVLVSTEEQNRLVSLLPPVHVALVPRSCIVPTLGDVLAKIPEEWPGEKPAGITFITGPSRTADIELKLVVGVHGPRWLHVIVVDGE